MATSRKKVRNVTGLLYNRLGEISINNIAAVCITMGAMKQYDPTVWDDAVAKLGGGVLQSKAWADFQAVVGRDAVRAMEAEKWAWQGFIRTAPRLRYLMLPYGPVIARDAAEALGSLVFAGEDQDADFVRIEPIGNITADDLQAVGAKKISEVEPQFTFVVDLTKPEEELKSALDSGHRNRVNTTEKRGIRIEQIRDTSPTPDFLRLMRDTASHAGIKNHADSYYELMAESLIGAGVASYYVSTVEGQPASISLVYDWGGRRYYAHTGNDQALNRQYKVAVSAVWRMMLDAKAVGLRSFDFWGAAPDDSPGHKWAGITSFKKGFGGERVGTIGTWDIPIHRTKYRTYTLYRKLRGRD